MTMLIEVEISPQKVADQLTAAFSGGSNYWLHTAKLFRSDNKPTVSPWYACPAVFERSFEIELGYDDPNGYEGEGKGRKRITQDEVRRAVDLMARDYPKRFAAMMGNSGDADMADAFVQCVMFGKVIYG
jgi:hypothetical protein